MVVAERTRGRDGCPGFAMSEGGMAFVYSVPSQVGD